MNEKLHADGFKRAAMRQRLCQAQDCKKPSGAWEAHHVVYEQHIKKTTRWLDAPPLERLRIQFDHRNAMRACIPCHKPGHHQRNKVIELKCLSDENIEYAAWLFGAPKAFNYLTRYYSGADARVDALLLAVAA